jgi:hypothetical protein
VAIFADAGRCFGNVLVRIVIAPVSLVDHWPKLARLPNIQEQVPRLGRCQGNAGSPCLLLGERIKKTQLVIVTQQFIRADPIVAVEEGLLDDVEQSIRGRHDRATVLRQ